MNIIIFSDSHLQHKFESRKFDFLIRILKKADQVVINGDFWDGYMCSFDSFIKSPWQKLFPILKKKKTVYVYGNHDQRKFSDSRVNLFSDFQTEKYEFKINTRKYIVEHGNKVLTAVDEKFPFVINPVTVGLAHHFEHLMLNKFGKKYTHFAYNKFNKLYKKKIKKIHQDGEIYATGHTHLAEIDEKNHFINSGVVKSNLGQYLLISDKGIELKEEWYA